MFDATPMRGVWDNTEGPGGLQWDLDAISLPFLNQRMSDIFRDGLTDQATMAQLYARWPGDHNAARWPDDEWVIIRWFIDRCRMRMNTRSTDEPNS